MRKVMAAFAVLMLVLGVFASAALHANEIGVTIDGVAVEFDGQLPTIVGGRTLVPVRGVFEALGFDVAWNQDSATATLINADFVVIITVGSDYFRTNGAEIPLDVPAQIIAGRTMLPIRAVVESVGYSVDWEQATSTVVIASEPASTPGQAYEFIFTLPEGTTLDTARHSPENFSRTWRQGVLPEFRYVFLEDDPVIDANEHGVVGMAVPIDPEIFGFVDAAIVLEIMFGTINHDGLYFLRAHGNRIEVSSTARSAVLNIPAWGKESNEFMSLFYMGQVLPSGEMYGAILFVIFDSLDEIGLAILNDYSARVGFDFLDEAISSMEEALWQINHLLN